jgi:hypothetical protein
MNDRQAIDAVRQAAAWFEPAPDGFGPLLEIWSHDETDLPETYPSAV